MAMTWKFRLNEDYVHESGLPFDEDVIFKDANGVERLRILMNGTICIRSGYSWDGCSPKIRIFDLGYLGTPDGVADNETAMPKTYHASLVHDALYQFMSDPRMQYSRKQMDQLFLGLMRDRHFSWSYPYYIVTRGFGWMYRKSVNVLRRKHLTY